MTLTLRRLLLFFRPRRAEMELASKRLFFILSLGRSGTTFLAHVLNKQALSAVYHEMYRDRDALVEAFWNPQKATEYLSGSRQRLIAARIINSQCEVYGEVNSYLRYHVDALQQVWQPTILHLVRDGRDVVRSIMMRPAFTEEDRHHTGRLRPRNGEPFADEWLEMDRFARVCWYWAHANRHLLKHRLPLVRLEDILSSYALFEAQVLSPLELTLSSEIWETEVGQPKNVSSKKSFPRWEAWSARRKVQFDNICGSTMHELGYEY